MPVMMESSSDEGLSKGPINSETSGSESSGAPRNREVQTSPQKKLTNIKKVRKSAAAPQDLSAQEVSFKDSPKRAGQTAQLVGGERKPRKRKRTKGRVARQGGAPKSERNEFTHFIFAKFA